MTLQQLHAKIDQLHRQQARHVRRGFVIGHADISRLTNHLIEEAAELQAAALEYPRPGHPTPEGRPDERNAVIEEAGDVISILAHVLYDLEIDHEEVFAAALAKLDRCFTTTPGQVTAQQVGFTRANRGPAPPG